MDEKNLIERKISIERDINSKKSSIEKFRAELSKLTMIENKAIDRYKLSVKKLFEEVQAQKLKLLSDIIEQKKKSVETLIDTFPEDALGDISGRIELKSIFARLSNIYPEQLLKDYHSYDETSYNSDGEVLEDFTNLERITANLTNYSGGDISSKIFDTIENIMTSIAESADGDDDGVVGDKKDLAIGVSMAVGLCAATIFVPFITIGCLLGLSAVGYIQGIKMKIALRKLSSIRDYITRECSYNVDLFQEDKSQTLEKVFEFLDEVKNDYEDELSSESFSIDESKINEIKEKFLDKKANIENNISSLDNLIASIQEELDKVNSKIVEEEEKQKQLIEKLTHKFLNEIDLKFEWITDILVDVTSDNKLILTPNLKGNILYLSDDITNLQNLARLSTYQIMLKSHTDFLSTVILDYKYMGGPLLQFQGLPPACCRLCYNGEDIPDRIEAIDSDMRARASNILSTCENIEAFNAMMAEYDSTGENYNIIHIFGLSSVTDTIKFILRNGPNVGYFARIYYTFDEFKDVLNDINLDNIDGIFEVSSTIRQMSKAEIEQKFNTK